MLVNLLVFPNGVLYLQSLRIAEPCEEADKLRQYWHRMMASDIWGSFVKIAETGKPDGLRSMLPDLIVML